MNLLEVSNLHTEFRTNEGTVQAVNGVNFDIESGEIVGLVGESGSGKSVLARSIMGLVQSPGSITDGSINLNGENLLEMSESTLRSIRGKKISMVFQDPIDSLNPVMKVGEQIAENIRLHQNIGESTSMAAELKRELFGSSTDTESWRQAISILESLDIPNAASRAHDYPHQFSGGMAQRVMVAMALSCQPDLLIADEPTTGLDVTVQAQILSELEDLVEEFDTSILLITHDLAVIAETCSRVNVMYAGEIIEHAPTTELFTNPMHPYTQAMLRSTPEVEQPNKEVKAIPGSVPDLIDIPYACHFAPRCPEATIECFNIEPNLDNISPKHKVSCLHRMTTNESREKQKLTPNDY